MNKNNKNLFEYIDFTGVTEESQVFVSILGELLCYFSPVQIKFVIHVLFENSEKFSSLSFIKFSDKNIFNKYIAGNFPLSKIHPNILSFLLCHQRCVVNQLNKSLGKEHFSAYSLFADTNYKDCKTGNESLNNFAEYTNFIVNQFTNSIAYSSSYDIIEKTVIHYLFDNFLMLIIGLYKYHEVAQVVTPMLFLIQTAIKNNIDLSKEENENLQNNIEQIKVDMNSIYQAAAHFFVQIIDSPQTLLDIFIQQKNNKESEEIIKLTNVMNQMDLTDTYRTFHTNTKEHSTS